MLAELGVLPWHSERESLPFARVHRHSRQKNDRGRQDRRQDGKTTSSKNTQTNRMLIQRFLMVGKTRVAVVW